MTMPPAPQASSAAAFRLRAASPPVMRLSRKVLMGLAGAGGALVAGALLWAMQQPVRGHKSGELYNIEAKAAPDGLASLPKDYAAIQVPPPHLPAIGVAAPVTSGADDPNAFLSAQEADAARMSKIFVSGGSRQSLPSPPSPANPGDGQRVGTDAAPPLDSGSLVNMQDRKLAFAAGPVDRRTVSADRLQMPPAHVLQAGSVIAAALITGMRSDLPGQVVAQVTERVYDSPTGNYLLIPQGSRLVGIYDSQVATGQDRLMLVWTRLLLPNGQSIILERQPAADPQGFEGVEDDVDQHWGRLALTAAISTIMGVGTEIGNVGGNASIASALRQGSGNSFSQTGNQLVGRQMNVQPTRHHPAWLPGPGNHQP